MKKLLLSVLLSLTLITNLVYAKPGDRPNKPNKPVAPVAPHKPNKPHEPVAPVAPHKPNKPDYSYQDKTIEKYVGHYFRQGETLALRQFLPLGQEFNGRRVKSVLVIASTGAGRGRVGLLVNERSVDVSSPVPTYISRITLMPGYYDNVLGSDIQTLKLAFDGNFWVQEVAVVLEGSSYYDDDHYAYPDLESFVGDYVYGNETKTLAIRQILNLDQYYNGRDVNWVMVKVRVEQGEGRVSLVINNNHVGLPTNLYQGGTQTILLRPAGYNNKLGDDIKILQVSLTSLGLRGRIYIESVGIKFKNSSY